jgi:nitrite reductase/ring-hydroxylating ferredoxin subunit
MKLPRRNFLKLTINTLLSLSGALGLGGLARFFSFQADPPPPKEFDLGPAANYPQGSVTVLPQIPATIRHLSKGYFAISMKCTHLGCTVEKPGESFECPCHGSRFDENGKLLRGPATRDLPLLEVEVNKDGNLIVRAS